MIFFSPRHWSIAWRLRAGLLLVPLLLLALTSGQYLMRNATVNFDRNNIERNTALAENTARMMQGLEEMQDAVRGYLTSPAPAFSRKYGAGRKEFYGAAKICAQRTGSQPDLLRRVRAFTRDGDAWGKQVAEPALRKAAEAARARRAAQADPSNAGARAASARAVAALTPALVRQARDGAPHRFSLYNSLHDATAADRSAQLRRADWLRGIINVSSLVVQALVIGLSLWICLGLARMVTLPLTQMVAHSRRIGEGDYAALPVERDDEFGQVTGAMNSMAAAIGSRAEREHLTTRLNAALSSSLDWDTVLQTAAGELGRALRASRCVIRLKGGAGAGGAAMQSPEVPFIACEWTSPDAPPPPLNPRFRDILFPPVERALSEGETQWSDDLQADGTWDSIARRFAHSDWQDVPDASRTRAVLACPLCLRGEAVGVIALNVASEVRQWSQDERELVESVSTQVAVALDNARLFRESQKRAAELQKARDALAQSSALLEDKNRELEEFVYTVSHDLKVPLISMQGYLAALTSDFGNDLPEEARFYIGRAVADSSQLQSLITELIDLSRIGRVRDAWEKVATGDLAREAASDLQLQAEKKGVRVEIAPNLPIIECERKRFRQIFVNLLDNAIKYSDSEKSDRWVRVECESGESDYLFCVRDNGLGLSPAHLEKAFAIFQRLGKNPEPGSGIGLSIVKRTAEAHSGRAWAESDGLGQGSTFCFWVARMPNGVMPDNMETSDVAAAASDTKPLSPSARELASTR